MNVSRGFLLAAGLTGSVLGAGCGEKAQPQTTDKPVFEKVYHVNGSAWPVECYGPVRKVAAEAGDILLKLVLENTNLVQPANLGRPNVPQEVYLSAVADINKLPDPNVIVAGRNYLMPDRCQPQ